MSVSAGSDSDNRCLPVVSLLSLTAFYSLSLQVSMLTREARSSQQGAQELFVYDVQTGTISIFSSGDDLVCRAPQQHFWDAEHPLLLACEMARTRNAPGKRKGTTTEGPGLEVATLFATPQGIVLQECQSIESSQVCADFVLCHTCCPPSATPSDFTPISQLQLAMVALLWHHQICMDPQC